MKTAPQREPEKQREPRGELLEQAWKQNTATWSKTFNTLFIHFVLTILGASWVDNGSTKRARKATPAPRRALGTGMEAKCSNMEQKVKTSNFIKVL